MKVKIIISFVIGSLFYVSAFNHLWIFCISDDAFQMTRKTSSWSIYYDFPEPFSTLFSFINPLQFAGLIVAIIIAWFICRRLQVSRVNLLALFIIALLISKLFLQRPGPFSYDSFPTTNGPSAWFILRFLLLALAGTLLLVLPLYFRYFKYANPGGKP